VHDFNHEATFSILKELKTAYIAKKRGVTKGNCAVETKRESYFCESVPTNKGMGCQYHAADGVLSGFWFDMRLGALAAAAKNLSSAHP
jgi:hypothetical protein